MPFPKWQKLGELNIGCRWTGIVAYSPGGTTVFYQDDIQDLYEQLWKLSEDGPHDYEDFMKSFTYERVCLVRSPGSRCAEFDGLMQVRVFYDACRIRLYPVKSMT